MRHRTVRLSEIMRHPRVSLSPKDYMQPKLSYSIDDRVVRCAVCRKEFAVAYYIDEYNRHYGLDYICDECKEVKHDKDKKR